jgi:hypothetical protein
MLTIINNDILRVIWHVPSTTALWKLLIPPFSFKLFRPWPNVKDVTDILDTVHRLWIKRKCSSWIINFRPLCLCKVFGTRPVADRPSGTILTCPIGHCSLTSHHLRYLWILLYTVSVYTAVYNTKLSLVFNERNVASVVMYFISYKFSDSATSVPLSFYSTSFLVGPDSAVGTATR